jgi:uncharacterized membrane protein YbhN (UPF0104 family)
MAFIPPGDYNQTMRKTGAGIVKILRGAAPWAVAAALLYYLFQKYPPAQVWEALRWVRLPAFLGFGLLYFLLVLVFDTWGLARVLSQFAAPVGFRELIPARCVSYLLAIFNYNAGQAALAAYLKKTRGVGFFKTLGAILFLAVIDLYWIIALAFLGSFFYIREVGGVSLTAWVQRVGYVSLAALLLHLTFWRRWYTRILPGRFHFSFLDWIRGRHLFQAFHQATVFDYFRAALYRFPVHVTIISSYWLLIRLFHAELPFQEVMATVPLIFLLGAIPLTPGGLGAVQIASVELLKDRVVLSPSLLGQVQAADLLFAMSLSWMFLNYSLKILTGLYFFLRSSPWDIPHSRNKGLSETEE